MFPQPQLSPPRRLVSINDPISWLAVILTLTVPGRVSAQIAAAESVVLLDTLSAIGTIPLPIDQSFGGPGLAFGITHTGGGRLGGGAGRFQIKNPLSRSTALEANTTGSGRAGLFKVVNAASKAPALEASTSGTGPAGSFHVLNSNSVAAAVEASTVGAQQDLGAAARAGRFILKPGGIGIAIEGIAEGSGGAGNFWLKNTTSMIAAVTVTTQGTGPSLRVFTESQTNNAPALSVNTSGVGWAGEFSGKTRGVVITTDPGGTGLQVVNGSKSAVVRISTGARALYSEEATEVWFTDYGFGQLTNGRAHVLIDPVFAQTVNLNAAYHVFVQPYGDAKLYVKDRTNLGFVVMGTDGDPNVEFGYRVVAKRNGFEGQRLERAPWADNGQGF